MASSQRTTRIRIAERNHREILIFSLRSALVGVPTSGTLLDQAAINGYCLTVPPAQANGLIEKQDNLKELLKMANLFLKSSFFVLLCLSLASCGDSHELPGIHAGEGIEKVQVGGGGFWVESHIGDTGDKSVVIFRTLIVYPKIDGFGSHSLSSTDDAQVIKLAKNNQKEKFDVILYKASSGILTIDGRNYKVNLGDYFLIDLSGFPAVRVVQKSSPKSDENTDANILLKNFQTSFLSESLIQVLKLPERR